MIKDYVDDSIFYANQSMINNNYILSINTGLLYDITNWQDVRIVKKMNEAFIKYAQMEIQNDGACFIGEAMITINKYGKLILEY